MAKSMTQDTEAEIRQREQSNETPDIAADDDVDEQDDGGSGLPIPNLTRKQWAIIGGIAAAFILWQLYKRNRDADSGGVSMSGASSDETAEEAAELAEEEAEADQGDNFRVDNWRDDEDPLAGDEAVTAALRESGTIGDPEA